MGKAEHLIKPTADDTESDSVCTPREVLEPLYEHFGYIALDPYSHPHSIVKAQTYIELPKYNTFSFPRPEPQDPRDVYAADDWARHYFGRKGMTTYGDGNAIAWPLKGLVFGNGPFSDLDPQLIKMDTEAKRGVEIVGLFPSRTSHTAVQRYVSRATSVVFWKGRVRFVWQKDSAPFHVMLPYWGKRPELFAKCFPKMWRVGK